MATYTNEFLKLRSFTTVTQELNNWISGTEAFTLLVSAIDSGLLNTLRSPCTVQQIAATTGLDEGSTSNVLNALENHGLVKGHGDVFTLTSNIKNMMKENAIQSLVPFIQAARTRLRTLQDITCLSKDYTELGADETLSMAQGIGIASVSPVCQSIGALTGQTMPELKKRWQSGAHHLELGCGVGNALFQVLTTFPKVTAKGIEINASIAAEARRRAGALGLADRVEVVHGNAADLKDTEIYDTAHWSQFFFPECSRAEVLGALFSAMKPGGYVCMPLLATASETFWAYRRSMLLMGLKALISSPSLSIPYINAFLTSSKRHEKEEKRLASLQKVIFERWGIPVKTAGELKTEVERFGFHILRAIPVPVSQFSEARSWLLAERA